VVCETDIPTANGCIFKHQGPPLQCLAGADLDAMLSGERLQRGITRRLAGGEAHEDFVAAECAARGSRQCLGRLNDLVPDRRVRIVTFYPCRYDCPTASAYAAAVFAAAVKVDALAAAELRAALVGEMRIGVDGTRGPAATPGMETLTVDFANF